MSQQTLIATVAHAGAWDNTYANYTEGQVILGLRRDKQFVVLTFNKNTGTMIRNVLFTEAGGTEIVNQNFETVLELLNSPRKK